MVGLDESIRHRTKDKNTVWSAEKILASEHSLGVLMAFVSFLNREKLFHLEEIAQIDCYLDEVRSKGIDVDSVPEDLWEDS
jgi:hypothetical protein